MATMTRVYWQVRDLEGGTYAASESTVVQVSWPVPRVLDTTVPETVTMQTAQGTIDASGKLVDASAVEGLQVLDPNDTSVQPHGYTLTITVMPQDGRPAWTTYALLATPRSGGGYDLAENTTGVDPAGKQWFKGDTGSGLVPKGHVANAAARPANPASGDAWVTDDDGHLSAWDGTSWIDMGQWRGPVQTVQGLAPDGAGNVTLTATSVGTAGVITPQQYGAMADNIADDTAAIQAAINAANTAGKVVLFPAGTYRVTSAISIFAGMTLQGMGDGSTIIAAASTHTGPHIFGITTAAHNYSMTISNMHIVAETGAGVALAHGVYMFAPSDSRLTGLRITGIPGNAITLDASGTVLGTANEVRDVFVRSCGGDGISVKAGCTDTIITGCDVGSCTGKAFLIAGIQAAIVASIGWGSAEGLVCDATSGLVWVSGCRFDQNQFYGVWVLAPNVTMTGCLIYDNSATATNTQPGILLDAGSANTVITGCRAVGGLNSGPQQNYGLQFGAGAGSAIIADCDFEGNGVGAITGTIPAGARVDNVRGFDPASVVTTPAVSASATVVTNNTGVHVTVYVTGGTGVAVSVGAVATGMASGAFSLPPGATITLTYTAAPTWAWLGA